MKLPWVSREYLFARKNLIYRELFDQRKTSIEDVSSEEKLLLDCSVYQIRSSKILVYLADRDVEVQSITHVDQDSAEDQDCMVEQEGKLCSKLDVHAPEFNSPSDR